MDRVQILIGALVLTLFSEAYAVPPSIAERLEELNSGKPITITLSNGDKVEAKYRSDIKNITRGFSISLGASVMSYEVVGDSLMMIEKLNNQWTLKSIDLTSGT